MQPFHIHWFDRVTSTHVLMKERVGQERPAPSGMVIAAREQTRGRGRMGRSWSTGVGENLAFSVWVAGATEVRNAPSSGMAAALAVSDFLEGEGLCATVKWPNDVQVNRKKIGGILSERLPLGLILGIGLNVNMPCAGHIDQPATSMRMETGLTYDLETLLPRLLEFLGRRLDVWRKGGFSAIRSDWERRAPDLGRPITVRDGDQVRAGVLEAFGEVGELLLREPSGDRLPIWAGDVYET